MARTPAEVPREEVHVARKEYLCADPLNRGCSRRIAKGDPYVQRSYAPGHPSFRSHLWTILRCCPTCVALPADWAGAPAPCGYGSGDAQCLLAEGHYPATDHEIREGLF